MKKLFGKIILITTLIIACSSAMAVYIDTPSNVALLHCDTTNHGYWITTPDDNSSGRVACEPILNMTNGPGFLFDNNTIPTFMPDSPYGGDYLSFNGSNSSIYVDNGWVGDISISLDFSFRWLGLPLTNDNFASVFACVPWRCYFRSTGDRQHGFLQFLLTPDEVFFPASGPIYLTSNVWYDVHFRWFEHDMILIIGNPTDGYATNSAYMSQDLDNSATRLLIGYPFWVPTRMFEGDLDEIRYGYVIPEPFLFTIYYLLFIIYYRKKFNSKN